MKDIKVGILSIHPAPYRDYIFNELQKEEGITFEVINYFAEDKGHKEWDWHPPEYPGYFLENKVRLTKKDSVDVHLWNKLMKSKYDLLIIPGYFRFNSIVAIIYSVSMKVPFIINLDTAVDSTGKKERSWFKNILVLKILRKASAFWVPGSASRKYLEHYNIEDNKIFEGSYCLPISKILSSYYNELTNRNLIRGRLNIPYDSFVWLAVGNFIKNRSYKKLVELFHSTFLNDDVFLIIVGDGNEKKEIENYLINNHIRNIILPGAVSFNQLFCFYALADSFIHPGKEPYSTATEIAAHCGIPILASYGVGYIYDLKSRGTEPLIFDLSSSEDLKDKMKKLVEDEKMRLNLGIRLKEVANTRTINWAKEELKAAIIKSI